MMVRILGLDDPSMRVGYPPLAQSVEEQYPRLRDKDGRGTGYALPYNRVIDCLRRIGLCSMDGDIADLMAEASEIAKLHVQLLSAAPEVTYMKPEHDAQIIQLVSLLGDLGVMMDAAPSVCVATHDMQRFRIHRSLAGLLAASMLDDNRMLQEQNEWFQRSGPTDRSVQWPSKPLARAFAQRDDRAFTKAFNSGMKRYLDRASKVGALSDCGGALDLSRISPSYLWPWPECALGCEMHRVTGWKTTRDDPWIVGCGRE